MEPIVSAVLVVSVAMVSAIAGSIGTTSFGGMLFAGCTVLFVLGVASLMHRRWRRTQRVHLWNVQDTLKDPRVAQLVLGSNMPLWLTFPSIERSLWLQNLIDSLWPRIAKATEGSVTAALNPILTEHCPPFLTKLSAKKVSFGSKPLQINGVQVHSSTERTTILDLQVQWNGSMDIRIAACMGPVEVDAILKNFSLKGTLRVSLGPHCDVWPCFAAMSLSFVGKPLVDFELSAAKVPLDAIPGLSQFLDSFVKNTLVWLMVYPKRLVLPVLDPAKYGAQQDNAEPVGTLCLTIQGCDSLPKRGIFTTTSPYITAGVTSRPRHQKRTKTASKTRDPRWTNEKYNFLVYNVPNERLILQVYHDTHESTVSKYGNVIMKDKSIASLEIFVHTLMTTPLKERKLHYPLNSTGGGRSSVDDANGSSSKDKDHHAGYISFAVTFKPFQTTESSREALLSKSAPGTEGGGDGESGEGGLNIVEREALSMLGTTTSLKHLESLKNPVGGLLLITLDKCNDLVKADLFGKSDPYVVFSVGSYRARSETIMKTLDPVYDDASFELECTDVVHEVLKVQVYDFDKVKGFTSGDEEIGNCRIPLSEVVQSNCRVTSTWPLNPKGTITMTLKLLLHEFGASNIPPHGWTEVEESPAPRASKKTT